MLEKAKSLMLFAFFEEFLSFFFLWFGLFFAAAQKRRNTSERQSLTPGPDTAPSVQGARPASTPEFGFRQSFQVVFSHLWWPSPWNETISDPAATRGFRQGRGCQTVVSGNFD